MNRSKVLEYIKTSKRKYKNKNELILNISDDLHIAFNTAKNFLDELISSGSVILLNKKFVVVEGDAFVKGKLIGNNKGYAFVEVPDRSVPDFFIPPTKLNGALNGDLVVIRPLSKTDLSQEAEVVTILERNNTTIVGVYEKMERGDGIVTPDNNKLNRQVFVKSKDSKKAQSGDKVVAKVFFDKQKGSLNGQIIEILGRNDDFKTLELALIREHKLYEIFPKPVTAEAEAKNVKLTEKDFKNRVDLRNETIFTIDGEDAKDLDDAVSIKKNGKNYVLGVHIADVGNYVKMGSELDKEAYLRGTSAYFPNLVLPMLPKALSNGICSLNEGVDRLTLSVEMEITPQGEFVKHKIFESVIKSKARLTYTSVYAVLCGDEQETKRYQDLKESFFMMQELSETLSERRKKTGMLDLDVPEVHFELDENEKVRVVAARERNAAHILIENFMVAANETIAKHFATLKLPFIYRVHEKPTKEKIDAFLYYLNSLGLSTPEITDCTPGDVQELLKLLDGKPYEQIANKVLLRSLQKARYLEDCIGHFGLALDYYCHFTSPIRRYPDLCIHRIIKESLKGQLSSVRKEELGDFVVDAAFRSSDREKNADDAERDVDDLYKAYYMQDHLNEEFIGTISGVQSYGFYVELDNTIEGLVRIENLPGDGYLFFEKSYMLKNQARQFKLGDKVKVKAISANLYDRKIEFVLAEENNQKE